MTASLLQRTPRPELASRPAPGRIVWLFLAFAFAYFISTLVRAVTATLSPILSQELSLQAHQLGLLAGGYFLGFALTQLPLGAWLDKHGPRRVEIAFLIVAVLGSVAFSLVDGFAGLLIARVVLGMGLSACLMAPLTGYRRWLSPGMQLRANSWMLMTGSLGMLASTLPVQWALPALGWRGVFWVLAVALVFAIVLLRMAVPSWSSEEAPTAGGQTPHERNLQLTDIWRHPYFRLMAPLGFVQYGGMIAIQTLWAGPWLNQVTGQSAEQTAAGLFAINLTMLLAFWLWGIVNPHLSSRGWPADRLMAYGLPLSYLILAAIIWLGSAAGWAWWAAFCVACTPGSLAQPAVAMAMPAAAAGRALSSFNLVLFAGIFCMQWAIGLAVDAFGWLGLSPVDAYRSAMAVFLLCSLCAYMLFRQGLARWNAREQG